MTIRYLHGTMCEITNLELGWVIMVGNTDLGVVWHRNNGWNHKSKWTLQGSDHKGWGVLF